jgi:hypothetical protein
MTNLPAEPDRPDGAAGMRASDSDRDRVAEVLREAAAEGRLSLDELDERLDVLYKTKTYAELEPITADLPAAGTRPAPAPAARGGAFPPDRFGGHPSGSVAVAVMSGFSRKGSWVAPKEMTAITIMGGIQITVPEDAHVQVNGVGFMGAFDDSRADGEGQPGGPHIIINGFAFWGGVAVERKPPRKPRTRKAVDSNHQGELGSGG